MRRRFAGLCTALATGLLLILASQAVAAETAPVWKILAVANPTNFTAGGEGELLVTAINVGGASTDGSPVTVSDALPAGLTAVEVTADDPYKYALDPIYEGHYKPEPIEYAKSVNFTCSSSPQPSCTDPEQIDPGDAVNILVKVTVASGLTSIAPATATVSGGGASSASAGPPISLNATPPTYGVAPEGLAVATSTSQAGAHPNLTTSFFLNSKIGTVPFSPVEPPKDIRFDLPPGLVGNTVGLPRCTMAAVIKEANCPSDTMVGTATLTFSGQLTATATVPIYNIAPAPGEPAAFGFNGLLFPARLDTSVLSDGNYAVRVTASDLTEGAGVMGTTVTIWGVPADHNGAGPDLAARNLTPEKKEEIPFGGPGAGETRVPLLTNPSQCSTPLQAELSTDSWEGEDAGPGVFKSASASLGAATGCDLLSFTPSVSMLPDTLQAGAPAGYSFDLHVPQEESAEGLASPDVRKVVATLPSGTVISPSAADGLGVCSSTQFFGSGPPEQAPAAPGACPRDSQVGTVEIKTPALPLPLQGDVYLASPECGTDGICTPEDAQDGHMIRLFLQVVGEGESGIVVKLEGKGYINQQTGQLTAVFENDPQLPFSELKLTLAGGERATLANPRTCGLVTTNLDLTAWSAPFTSDATPFSGFEVDEGCFGPQFEPSFTAGTTSNQAGGYSPFTVSFGRSDADEFLNGVQMKLPPGLLANVASVPQCAEPQAAQGTCSEASLIGHTTVETGPGADPFLVSGGKVFLTGPYKGAPYGLSIVVPAVAGPYTLAGTTGNGTVVVRAAIDIDPSTAAITVTSDPLPTVLDGIPLQLRLVNVTVERPGFTFNPTTCDPLAITGTLTSTQAAAAAVSSHFQVTNCQALKFQPKFAVSTSGKTSKADGASLDAKVTFPTGSQGTEANFAAVKVDLPKQLPSRLTTLQKACLAAVFDANPANCPAASVVGIVRANTPILPVQLRGPVYFVSHGGEAFPSLEVVLQGDGVRVDLVAATFISKAGITSSTFKTIPDVPVSSFELYLPEGKYSALAANGNLCTSTLAMPTAFVAQNGAEIHESTKITASGCPKAKKAAKKTKKTKKAKAKKSSRARNVTSGDRRQG